MSSSKFFLIDVYDPNELLHNNHDLHYLDQLHGLHTLDNLNYLFCG